jgi:basic membrane lipoprotein Med (substrate-binding protein (PBP1-ABC) superfamily)
MKELRQICTGPVNRFSTVVHIALCALLAACSHGESSKNIATSDSPGTAVRPVFRVALLTPGPVSDQSWNGGAYAGLMRMKDSLGAQTSHIETKTPAEFEENFRQYGAQGYALVIGHGFEFQDAAKRVAPDYPKTVYLTTSGNQTAPPNLGGIDFGFEEASYLAGMEAGGLTKSNVVGVLGGTELPPVKRSFEAFERGAKRVNPAVHVVSSYVGNWDDVGAGKEQALAQIGRGADVIFQNADAAGLGVFQAARERPGVLVFGSNSNQNSVAPDVTVGSVVIDLPHAFMLVGREVQAGKFVPRVITLGWRDDVVKLVMNPTFTRHPDAKVEAAMDSVRHRFDAGESALQVAGVANADAR